MVKTGPAGYTIFWDWLDWDLFQKFNAMTTGNEDKEENKDIYQSLTGTPEWSKLLEAGRTKKAPKLNWCTFQGPKAQNYWSFA